MKSYLLYALAYGCPKGVREKDCPLLEIEGLSFIEKVNWIDKLNGEQYFKMVMHHADCVYKVKSIDTF